MLERIVNRFAKKSFGVFYFKERFLFRRYQRLNPDEFALDARGRKVSANSVVDQLRDRGIAVMPEFYPEEFADRLYKGVVGLNRLVESGEIPADPQGNLLSPALSWSQPLRKQGIIRIHHADQKVPDAARFRDEPFFKKIGRLYYGEDVFNQVTISQYNEVIREGCRGYHIDSHLNQFKAFIYLNDVTETNGPHDYVIGSHTIDARNLRRAYNAMKTKNTSVPDEEAKWDGYARAVFPGKRGTVLLVDTRGIHQGANLAEGHRAVLTNYYYLDKDRPELGLVRK